MPTFWIWERVPVYVAYRKLVTAESQEEALRMARADWAGIDAPEVMFTENDLIEGMSILYEAEPAKAE